MDKLGDPIGTENKVGLEPIVCNHVIKDFRGGYKRILPAFFNAFSHMLPMNPSLFTRLLGQYVNGPAFDGMTSAKRSQARSNLARALADEEKFSWVTFLRSLTFLRFSEIEFIVRARKPGSNVIYQVSMQLSNQDALMEATKDADDGENNVKPES